MYDKTKISLQCQQEVLRIGAKGEPEVDAVASLPNWRLKKERKKERDGDVYMYLHRRRYDYPDRSGILYMHDIVVLILLHSQDLALLVQKMQWLRCCLL